MTDNLQILIADRVVPGTGVEPITPGYVAIKSGYIIETGPVAALDSGRLPEVCVSRVHDWPAGRPKR